MIYDYKLSICMMVKDEEKNLDRCLSKLKPIADTGLAEIIIVDTGSQDETVSIAKKYTNKVYFHKWNKNFSEMRNISISYAKGQWIFIIDADERLDDTEKVITLIQSEEIKEYNSVFMQVKNLYDYEDEDRYNVILSPRIFRNNKDFRYEGAVHNQPIFNGPNLSVDISLTHYGYIGTDKELMEKKYKRTVELLKYELEKEPENLYYIYQLGVSYDMHSDFKDSLKEFRKAYNIMKRKKLDTDLMYTYILGSYARIAYTNGELNEMIEIAKKVVSIQSEYIDMYYLLGIAYRQLGNIENAIEYFSKYIDLLGKYNDLEISKDLTIIMYHMDKNSVSNANFELFKYSFDRKIYNDAYKAYENITTLNQKIYSGINVLIELNKYKELRNLYLKLSDKKDKNTFLVTLESKLDSLENKVKDEIIKTFSLNNDTYGLFNQLRLNKSKERRVELINLLLVNIDFNKEPSFYAEIFIDYKDNVSELIKILTRFENINVRSIVQFLIEKEDEYVNNFEEYITQISIKDLELNKLRITTVLSSVLLLFNLQNNNKINDKYAEIFERYIELGISFVSELYQIDKAKDIYKNVNNIEDRFFLIMYLVKNDLMNKENKSAINYLIEALNIYEAMAKYIDVYKEELLCDKDDEKQKVQKQQFEEFKIQVKNNINSLINEGNLHEAKSLINEYKSIVSDDVELHSMEAVISILEGKLEEAEEILKKGLNIDHNNFDINYNLAFLYEQINKLDKAVKCYNISLESCSNEQIKEQIISRLNIIRESQPELFNYSKRKLVFFVKQGMDSFIDDIIHGFSEEYDTKKVIVTSYNQIDEGMQWADICWFEWCDELVAYGSNHELAINKKIICRIHGYEVYGELIKQPNWINVDDLIIVAPHIRRLFEENTSNLKKGNLKIHTIFCGIDVDKYPLLEKGKGYNLGYLGYINYKKNIPLTLDIFKMLYDKDNRYKLYIAGQFQDARTLAYFNYFIEEYKLQNSIFYEGWKNEEEKIRWFNKIDYMLISSIDEGLCFAAAEAMCSGIKPILHKCEGISDHYDKKYIFTSIEEAIMMIESDNYNSSEYRKFIEETYSLTKEYRLIKNILNDNKDV